LIDEEMPAEITVRGLKMTEAHCPFTARDRLSHRHQPKRRPSRISPLVKIPLAPRRKRFEERRADRVVYSDTLNLRTSQAHAVNGVLNSYRFLLN
jgi:hypothetical protein